MPISMQKSNLWKSRHLVMVFGFISKTSIFFLAGITLNSQICKKSHLSNATPVDVPKIYLLAVE